MAISNEIQRLQNAKAALKTAINAKNDSNHQIDDETLDYYADFVDEISTGGGTVQEALSKDVNFYDYDGKILYSYTASEFAQLTEMPANPTHTGLTSQGWNWTLADAKAQVTAVGACDIGQMYVTSDGKTRLYCTFEEFNKSFYLGLGVNGTVTINWGDGSSTSTLTGTNNGIVKNAQHTYTDAGDYVITLEISSGGSFAFLGGSQCSYLFRGNQSNAYKNRCYTRCLRRVEMGTGAYIRNYSFVYCVNLETITVNNNAFIGSTSLFAGCTKLKFATIPASSPTNTSLFQYNCVMKNTSLPKSVDTLGASVLYCAYNMKRFVFPNSVATIGNTLATNAYSLEELYLSNNITTLTTQAFDSCCNLRKIAVPSSVTTIATKAFRNCFTVKEYHFKSTTPPTLDNVDAFGNIASDCVIYVPSAKLNDYKTATNWSTYESYMVGE